MTFRYRALDAATGRVVEGELYARSKDELLKLLRSKGLLVTKVHKVRWNLSMFVFTRRLSTEQMIQFFNGLAAALRAGLSATMALEVLKSSTTSRRYKLFLDKVKTALDSGYSLSESLARTGMFSPAVIETIKAAETAGELPQTLEEIARNLEQDRKLASRLKRAMIYPVLVGILITGLVTVASNFMVPRVLGTITQILAGRELPPLTAKIITLYAAAEKVGPFVPAAPLALGGLWLGLRRHPKGRVRLDKVLVKAPLLGRLLRYRASLEYFRTLLVGIRAGINLTSSMSMAAKSIRNAYLAQRAQRAVMMVHSGSSLASAVRFVTGDSFSASLIHTAEQSGTVDEMLSLIVSLYSERAQEEVDRFFAALEPVTVILMGIVVLSVLIGVLVPLWESVQAVGALR